MTRLLSRLRLTSAWSTRCRRGSCFSRTWLLRGSLLVCRRWLVRFVCSSTKNTQLSLLSNSPSVAPRRSRTPYPRSPSYCSSLTSSLPATVSPSPPTPSSPRSPPTPGTRSVSCTPAHVRFEYPPKTHTRSTPLLSSVGSSCKSPRSALKSCTMKTHLHASPTITTVAHSQHPACWTLCPRSSPLTPTPQLSQLSCTWTAHSKIWNSPNPRGFSLS